MRKYSFLDTVLLVNGVEIGGLGVWGDGLGSIEWSHSQVVQNRGERSDRQWQDLLGVLKVRRQDLDLDYLELWAADQEIADLLERALADAGIADEQPATLRGEP